MEANYMKKKITKVVFEYGSEAQELTGEQAEKWLDTVNGMCVLAQNRGQNPFESKEFNWQDVSQGSSSDKAKERDKEINRVCDSALGHVHTCSSSGHSHTIARKNIRESLRKLRDWAKSSPPPLDTIPTEEEVKEYTRHKQSCKLNNGQMSMSRHERHALSEKDCDCGLTELLKRLSRDRLGSAASKECEHDFSFYLRNTPTDKDLYRCKKCGKIEYEKPKPPN